MTKEERATAIAEGKKKKEQDKKFFDGIIKDLNDKGLYKEFFIYAEKKQDELKEKKEQLEKEIQERQKQIEEIESQLKD